MAINCTKGAHIIVENRNVPLVWSRIAFGLFLFGQVMSIPCYFFMMYHLLATRAARKLLQNHVIIVMLIYNLIHLTIDLSMTMSYLRLKYVSSFVPILCLIQQFVDYGIWFGALFLMLWASIERHILIFHSARVATARGRLLFHYIPLGLFSLYAPIFYFYMVFLYPCGRNYTASKNMCGGPYYYSTISVWYIWYESFINYVIPILLIVVFSVSLLIRAVVQKRRMRRAAGWRRHRKMIIQIILVSAVYLIFDLPFIIIGLVQWAGMPDFGKNIQIPYISYLTYVPAIVLPYATLVTLPKLKKKLRTLIIYKANRRAIAPMIMMT